MPQDNGADEQVMEQAFTNASREQAGAPPVETQGGGSTAGAGAGSTPPEPERPAVFAAAEQLGIDVSQYTDEQALIADLWKQAEDAKRSTAEMQPYVEYARQVLPYDAQVRQVLQGAPAEPSQPAAGQPAEWDLDRHFSEAWKRPEYDKKWESFITSGMIVADPDTRQFVPADGYANQVPAQVLQGLNGRVAWQREALERLLEDPYRQTWEAFQEPLQRMVDDRVSQYVSQQESARAINQWEAENAGLLYETTSSGEVAYDISGNPRLTPYGQAFMQACQELQPLGDSLKILKTASQMTAHLRPSGDQAAGGTPPAEQTPQADAGTADGSFLDQAMEKAKHRPNSGAYAAGQDVDPLVQNVMELESLFKDAGRKAGIR